MKFSKESLENLVHPHVKDRVFKAFIKVDRREFVPQRDRQFAYLDSVISLGINSSISQPSLIAEMINLLDLKGEEKVLEIGTGSGYGSAILSYCCGQVYTVEINPDLEEKARERLKSYSNISVFTGDGSIGLADIAPFDSIIINAAVNEVPSALIPQLKEGGRIVVPIREELYMCQKINNKLINKFIAGVKFVPLITAKN